MSRSWLVHFAFTIAISLGLPQPSQAQKEPESYIAVIGRPGVVGAPVPSPGGAGAVVKGSPKLGETEPIRMKGKETISAPQGGVVSLLVFSKQHDGGKTAKGSINLKPGAKATIDPAAIDKDEDVLVDVERGSVRVIKEPKSKGVFRVRTPQATMAVRGTELWLKHEPAVGGKPAITLCAVPTGTVDAMVGDKKVVISQGSMLEIENGKAKPTVKIKKDTLESFASFRYEPTTEKWLILDCDDEGRKWNAFDINPPYISESVQTDDRDGSKFIWQLASDKDGKGGWNINMGVQQVNVSKYRYIAIYSRCAIPYNIRLKMNDPIPNAQLDGWFEASVKTTTREKWQWFIYSIEDGANSDSRLISGLVLSGSTDSPNKDVRIQISQVLFLRDLPSSMKDRVYQDKKPSP